MALIVRGATREDAPSVRALVVEANEEFRSAAPAIVFQNYVESVLALVDRGEDPRPGVLVAVDDAGRILGTGSIVEDGSSMHVDWPDGDVVLRGMAVAPTGRGLGVGGLIGRACVDWARAAGATGIGLHTGPFMTSAQRLYERLGFVRAPERDVAIDRIFGPVDDDLPYDDVALAYRLELAAAAS